MSSRRWSFAAGISVFLFVLVGCRSASESNTAEPTTTSGTVSTAEPVAPDSAGEATATVIPPAPTVVVTDDVASLSQIDFQNGFTYEVALGDSTRSVTPQAGYYQEGEPGGRDFFWMQVSDTSFGDLDGDGQVEATVTTSLNTGGTGIFDEVIVFRLRDGQVERAGSIPFGDRGDGGVFDTWIEDGVVRVMWFSTTRGACCPDEINESNLVMGSRGVVDAFQSNAQRWLPLSDPNDTPTLEFLAGTSSAIVGLQGPRASPRSFTFEAVAGQVITILPVTGVGPSRISIEQLTTGDVLSGDSALVLPADGTYVATLEIESSSYSNPVEVTIDSGFEPVEVSWRPVVEQTLVADDPLVLSTVVWPELVSSRAGVAASNQEIASFAAQIDDQWVVYATEETAREPQEGTYEASFTVLQATPSIVSVRFDYYEYLCCRPYPTYGPTAVVVDLATGERIQVDQILDLSRQPEINAVWLTALGDDLEYFDDYADTADLAAARWDTVAVAADGLEFGTSRGSLGGGLPGTLVVVTFADLGDLVHPEFLARLARDS